MKRVWLWIILLMCLAFSIAIFSADKTDHVKKNTHVATQDNADDTSDQDNTDDTTEESQNKKDIACTTDPQSAEIARDCCRHNCCYQLGDKECHQYCHNICNYSKHSDTNPGCPQCMF